MRIMPIRVLAVLFALGLVASACGSDSDSDTEAAAEDTTTTTAAMEEEEPATTTEAMEEEAEIPTMTAGLVVLAPVPALELGAAGFTEAAEACATVNIEVNERNAEGDIPTVSQIIEGFVADGVDFIAPVTTPAAQAAYQIVEAAGGTIPVAYSVVTDPFAAGLATDASTHPDFITGSQSLPPFAAVLDAAQAVVPDATIIGMPVAPAEANSGPIEEAIQALADERGLTLETAAVTDSSEVGTATEALISRGVEIIVLPTISTVEAGAAAMAQVADDNDIAVIGAAATMATNAASVAVGADYYAAGFRAGEIACAVLSGEATPADFDVINIAEPSTAVNLANAEAQGVTIPDSILGIAEVMG